MSRSAAPTTPSQTRSVEVAIVGGGPAGLQAALLLGRARRSVLVVDSGAAAHFASSGVHGLIGFENVPPREVRARVWEELAEFDVERVDDTVERIALAAGDDGVAEGDDDGGAPGAGEPTGFILSLAGGAVVRARRVILATGLRYGLQDVEGLEDLWYDGVYHCPFCHGWEVRGQRVAVIGTAETVAHQQTLLSLWADSVVAYVVGGDAAGGDDGGAAAGGEAAGGADGGGGAAAPVVRSVHRDPATRELVVTADDGGEVRVDAVFSMPAMEVVDDLAEQLGLERVDTMPGPMAARPTGLAVDAMGETAVPGVYAAGDLVAQPPGLVGAVATGNLAALGIVRAIAEERMAAATPYELAIRSR